MCCGWVGGWFYIDTNAYSGLQSVSQSVGPSVAINVSFIRKLKHFHTVKNILAYHIILQARDIQQSY